MRRFARSQLCSRRCRWRRRRPSCHRTHRLPVQDRGSATSARSIPKQFAVVDPSLIAANGRPGGPLYAGPSSSRDEQADDLHVQSNNLYVSQAATRPTRKLLQRRVDTRLHLQPGRQEDRPDQAPPPSPSECSLSRLRLHRRGDALPFSSAPRATASWRPVARAVATAGWWRGQAPDQRPEERGGRPGGSACCTRCPAPRASATSRSMGPATSGGAAGSPNVRRFVAPRARELLAARRGARRPERMNRSVAPSTPAGRESQSATSAIDDELLQPRRECHRTAR